LAFAVVALVAFAAMLVWVLAGPSGAEEPAAEAEPMVASDQPAESPSPIKVAAGPKQPAAEAARPTASPTLDVDLFAGPMPDFMTEAHARVLDKKWLDVSVQKQLYNFGQEHKDDARPQLLLAWDSMHREWYGIAVRMYRISYRADHRAKYDPSMLRDLLWIASRYDRTEFRETVEIVKEAYGEEALPRIDEEIAALRNARDIQRAERLTRLRAEIAGK
jgi:hypothetical protein